VRGTEQLLTLFARGPADRFDALDAEGLNDGLCGACGQIHGEDFKTPYDTLRGCAHISALL
jgi:hypothetical protein